jgi:hypothetical protein
MSTVAYAKIWTISKSIQQSQGINTQGESAESSAKRGKAGTLQSIPMQRREVQGLYKVCTREDV